MSDGAHDPTLDRNITRTLFPHARSLGGGDCQSIGYNDGPSAIYSRKDTFSTSAASTSDGGMTWRVIDGGRT